VEHAVRLSTRAALRRYEQQPAASLSASSVRFAHRAGLGLARLAAFAATSVGTFFILWQGHEAVRFIVLVVLSAIVGVRVFALFVELLLEPGTPRLRLLPFDDRAARVLYWGLVRLAALYALIRVSFVFLAHFGAPADSIIFFTTVASLLFVLLMLDTVWKVRADVGGLIRGPGESSPLRRLLAEVWPALAAIYLLAVFFSRLYDMLLGDAEPNNAAIGSVVLVLVLPLADMLLCRIVAAALHSRVQGAAQAPGEASTLAEGGVAEGFAPVLRRAVHIVVLVSGLLMLADLWGVDPFAMAEHSLGGRITSAIFGIAVTTLLAWILWEAARTAIDRRMNIETVADGKPVSRLRTLLPLLRLTLLATILVMAVLSILAALGINILPLLAGASVVGVAIGFGSQTLVRDIVSGAFFLMDDAFRLGEYIEVGDAKGVVEKIGVRAVILRHHRGALNVLPYGEIKRLRNTSRDWMIMKLEFRLAYDTNLKKVKQIIKKVGEEIAADPELARDLIEPLKSQGVAATDETGLVVRVKYMANPAGGGAYTIRREAFARIIAEFAKAGVKFAERRVTVNVPAGMSPDVAAGAAAQAASDPNPR
jgi:small-conductance mechanosensitive channel